MKLTLKKDGLRIEPETVQDEIYLREVCGVNHPSGKPRATFGITHGWLDIGIEYLAAQERKNQ